MTIGNSNIIVADEFLRCARGLQLRTRTELTTDTPEAGGKFRYMGYTYLLMEYFAELNAWYARWPDY